MALPYPVLYAIPAFFVTMLVEQWWLRRKGARKDALYEKRDWFASMCMGVGSLIAGAIVAPLFHGVMDFVYAHRLATIEVTPLTYLLLFWVRISRTTGCIASRTSGASGGPRT